MGCLIKISFSTLYSLSTNRAITVGMVISIKIEKKCVLEIEFHEIHFLGYGVLPKATKHELISLVTYL